MTSTNRQSQNFVEHQQAGYRPEENSRSYAMMNDVPFTNNEISHEQQIVYSNAPVYYQSTNNTQSYVYPQQLSNNQIVNQYPSTSLTAHHYQQQNIPSLTNIPLSLWYNSREHIPTCTSNKRYYHHINHPFHQ
jgi:hypothetical protein